ncbi:hypothetical protein T01_3443 [Trichinella spiralis]|uniref:Uncharacterized protein n=1 Tax=Trichinella spiralis TaxID=6334 RepID=A0A0V1B6Y1_TRISP|nr:hypothetical protein T01_3443 [Trichinella spiralis]
MPVETFSEPLKQGAQPAAVQPKIIAIHFVATESTPSDLQMELVKLKNNEPLMKKFEKNMTSEKHGM